MTVKENPRETAASLSEQLNGAYDKALRLSGVMQAIAHLENDSACVNGRIALVYLAEELAADLVRHLDTTPRAVAA